MVLYFAVTSGGGDSTRKYDCTPLPAAARFDRPKVPAVVMIQPTNLAMALKNL